MKKKTVLILLYIVLVGIIVTFAAQIAIEKTVTASMILRSLLSVALCLSAISRVNGTNAGALKVKRYRELYGDQLRQAFAEQGREFKQPKLFLAIDRYNSNRYDSALRLLDGLRGDCESEDDHCAVLLFIALTYTEMGLPEKAIDAYYELLRHDDRRSTAWSNLGLLFKRQGKHRDALACFANAVKYDEKNPYAYHNIASTYFALGSYYEAIEEAKHALDLKPDLYQAATTLCLAYCALGDGEQCEAYFTRAVTNGESTERLREAIETIRAGHLAAEPLAPIPDAVQKAMADFYTKTARPYLRACLPAERGCSRFGGAPIGEAPLDAHGEPMRLVCALDCREAQGLPDFPERGVLEFYIADDDDMGLGEGCSCVRYDPDATLGEPSDEVPEIKEMFPIFGCYRLRLVLDVGAMTDNDYRFDDVMNACLRDNGAPTLDELDVDVDDAVRERFHSEGHRVGGYPYFTQEDPRGYDEALRKYDTLLLQVDSHYSDKEELIMIGDAGVMNFFISRERLLARDFSDVYYTWDCG